MKNDSSVPLAARHSKTGNASQNASRSKRKEERIKGIPASPGIVMGMAIVVHHEPVVVQAEQLPPDQIDEEYERYTLAVQSCSDELQTVLSLALDGIPSAASILEAQLLILKDSFVNESIVRQIRNGYSAESAIILEFDSQQHLLKLAKDALLRERAIDLEYIKQRLLVHLRNKKLSHSVPKNSIIIASSLTPSEIMLFNESGMTGFVTEISGIASHTSILARSLHIPAVIGLRHITDLVQSGTNIIIDGYAGVMITNPRVDTILKYERRQEELEKKQTKFGRIAKLPSQTTDNRKIHLFANIDTAEDIDAAIASGADGIGLVRTEHLIMKYQRFPTEEEQFQWYTDLAERAYPLPITIRAFDIGSDKSLESLPPEPNPALGLRGIRFLLQHRDLFKEQIRAILRASHHRNIRFMLPMISSISELQKARDLIEKCKQSLGREDIPFDAGTRVGVMIETPAAVLMAQELGAMADFFSIGTNDLTQYTLAADRINVLVTNIFDAFHPAVLRSIKMTVEAARHHGIPVGICGEIAGHAAATELLIGLGVEELSVVPQLLLELKKRIRKTTYSHSVLLANEVIHYSSGTEIRRRISLMRKR